MNGSSSRLMIFKWPPLVYITSHDLSKYVTMHFLYPLLVDAQFEDYCVADEQATEVVLGYAMKWACSNGADCTAIQPDGTCFFPNTTKDHASYAFNSYFQNMKHNGGSCYFTANAVLTGVNPSKKISIPF